MNNNGNGKRAITYGRVSGDDRGKDGRNLASQLEMCREYCQQKGYTIVAELAEDDRGASGADFDLPMLNQALELARAGEADVLVVRELDRFARKLAKQLVIEQEFKRAGCEVEYVLAEYADTPEGELQKQIRAVIAEYEREKITERMVRGRRNRVKAGNVVTSKAPYGYQIVKVDGKCTLEVYGPEARIVRLIFDWYTADGLPLRGIATRLTDMGATNGRKKTRWWKSTVREIMASEVYIGTWHYGKVSEVNGKKVKNPRETWLPVAVPAIVDKDVWDLARARLKLNREDATRNLKHETKYLLRRFTKCARCGTSLRCQTTRGETGKLYFYYTCQAAKLSKTSASYAHAECDSRTCYRADRVDAAAWAWIDEKLADPAELRRELENRQAEREAELAPLRQRLAVIDDLLSDNQKQMERLLDLYLSGDFPKEALTERKARLETTINALDKERRSLAAALKERVLTPDDYHSIEDFARDIRRVFEAIDDDDFEAKRGLVERLALEVRLTVEDGEQVAYIGSPVLGESGALSVVSCKRDSPVRQKRGESWRSCGAWVASREVLAWGQPR